MSHSLSHFATRAVWRLIGCLAFNRITVVGREHLPRSGAVLYVATHRNGALDGAPYTLAVPAAVPMVSAQLHRTAFGRLLFQGIPVARAKDRERGIAADNRQSIERCISLLKHDGQLLVMPEGTSTLGFRHLPYQRGAARIAHAALDAGIALTIVPLGVHYEDPTAWQSRAEVLVGEPVQLLGSKDVAALHRVITQALESVGANFASEDEQRNAEALAYACTLGTDASYALSLKHFEQADPEVVARFVQPLASFALEERMCTHQGVPLVPVGPWPLYVTYWLVLAPLVAAFSLLNAPVLGAGWIASRKLPDAPNVIAFWRMVAGLPAGLVWATLASVAGALAGGVPGAVTYWAITVAGVAAWYRFRKLSVALCNGLFHAGAKPALLRTYQDLKENMPHARTA